jgi:poly(hydroxyalkanoate) granule associated protein phasin
MLKSALSFEPNRISEAAMVASRQVWLASLGAAVVTRDWMQAEAGGLFKSLVKEGTLVESRAIRFLGDRIENTVSKANIVWKHTRRNVESTVKQAATAAVGIAQQVLPKSLPAFELPMATKAAKPAAKRAHAAKRPAKAARSAKRSAKATKRA